LATGSASQGIPAVKLTLSKFATARTVEYQRYKFHAPPRFQIKKLFLVLSALCTVIGNSLTALADEDLRDHNWNDDYWHHHHYGYWHGERGHWIYHDHKHEFIRVGPDIGGVRTRIARKGITFNAQYIAEVWGNPTGGESNGTVYTGLMSLQGNVDLQKLLGWTGASFSTRWYWLSGHDISADYVGNIFTVSSIAGFPTFRMNELWFQQNFLSDRISVRVGQLGADSEFDISTYSVVFLNSTFGWSPFLFANIPNGGPSYPMGTPGVRMALTPVNWLTYRGTVLQGNPFAQNVNRYGFRWDLTPSNGYFSIHEMSFRINQATESEGLPGTFKIAGWFDTAPDPNAGSAQPWNYGFYFLADQMLYRASHSISARAANAKSTQTAEGVVTDKGLGAFTHIGVTQPSSSFINFYIDGGLNYRGLIPTRDNDLLGVAVAYGHLDNGFQDSEDKSNPGYEIVVEATYQIDLAPWLSLQPDFQYVIHPSGTDIPNALVLGARTTMSF
jgi:porin